MDEIKDLKRCLTELNKELPNCKKNGGELELEFLVSLTEKQKQEFRDGSRIPQKELKKVTSSEALTINRYLMYEGLNEELKGKIRLQRKLEMPVKQLPKKGKKTKPNSNSITRFDVSYQQGNEIHFVEGKFLEPYYHNSHKRHIKDEFLTSECYLPEMGNVEKWLRFAEKWKEFKHFDFPQMYKHLLAIHYHRMLKPNVYAGKTVRLQSVSWLMTDKFLSHYKEMKGVRLSYKRLKNLCDDAVKEEDRAQKEFNDFIQAIGMKDFVFEIKHYNDPDMLKEIARSDKFEAFKRQYLLDYKSW